MKKNYFKIVAMLVIFVFCFQFFGCMSNSSDVNNGKKDDGTHNSQTGDDGSQTGDDGGQTGDDGSQTGDDDDNDDKEVIDYDIQFINKNIKKLNVKSEGKLKILLLTDIQFHTLDSKDYIKKIVSQLVDRTKPDLILHLGDISEDDHDQTPFFEAFVEIMDSVKTPWATVFGNHDYSGMLTKKECMEIILNSKYNYNLMGPDDMNGITNSNIVIKQNNEAVLSVSLLDTRDRAINTENGVDYPGKSIYQYGYLTPAQIDYYSKSLSEIGKKYGDDVKNISIMHICLPEYSSLYSRAVSNDAEVKLISGERRETECGQGYNSGLLSKAIQLNKTIGIFAGHDHVNNYILEYRNMLIGYATKTGNNSYFNADVNGGTLLTYSKEDNKLEAELVFYNKED